MLERILMNLKHAYALANPFLILEEGKDAVKPTTQDISYLKSCLVVFLNMKHFLLNLLQCLDPNGVVSINRLIC